MTQDGGIGCWLFFPVIPTPWNLLAFASEKAERSYLKFYWTIWEETWLIFLHTKYVKTIRPYLTAHPDMRSIYLWLAATKTSQSTKMSSSSRLPSRTMRCPAFYSLWEDRKPTFLLLSPPWGMEFTTGKLGFYDPDGVVSHGLFFPVFLIPLN